MNKFIKKVGFIIPVAALVGIAVFASASGFNFRKLKYYYFYLWLSTPFLLMIAINFKNMSTTARGVLVISMLATIVDMSLWMMRFFKDLDAQGGIALLFLPPREVAVFCAAALISYILYFIGKIFR